MIADTHVVEVTDATFEEVVVEGSKQRPVVIDLWATWCGPCKTLGPILEKVAGERQGAFLLAKLDVDANPMVAQALGVQSIPTVVAFKDGEPVNGFVGSYPEEAVNQFVDELVPTEAELEVEEAQAEAEAGDLDGAEQDFRDALAKDPQNRDAALGLARILVGRGDLDEARPLLTPLEPDPEAERLLASARVQEWGARPPGRRGGRGARTGRRRALARGPGRAVGGVRHGPRGGPCGPARRVRVPRRPGPVGHGVPAQARQRFSSRKTPRQIAQRTASNTAQESTTAPRT